MHAPNPQCLLWSCGNAGEQEAVLAFKGATACLCSGSSSASLCVVVDLGGRSTEVAVGECNTRISSGQRGTQQVVDGPHQLLSWQTVTLL